MNFCTAESKEVVGGGKNPTSQAYKLQIAIEGQKNPTKNKQTKKPPPNKLKNKPKSKTKKRKPKPIIVFILCSQDLIITSRNI